MNENLDLTKILEGCPEGTGFYSTTYGMVEFIGFEISSTYPILMRLEFGGVSCFTKDGKLSTVYNGECTLFPSKDQRDWSKFERFWDKPKVERFDPKTLKPFDKILARDGYQHFWCCELFSYLDDSDYPVVGCSISYKYCIPYNEETKHLVGTNEDCPDYYKWWEK